jgi:hypothetical protein
MSEQVIRLIIAGVLLLHGLGHGIVLGAHIWIASGRTGLEWGDWQPLRSWLFPSLAPPAATAVASIFLVVALIGFIAAAMSFWGILVPGDIWRQLAIVSAIVSIIGIVPFLGRWAPTANTLAALGVNIAVLVALLWLNWPPLAMFGK